MPKIILVIEDDLDTRRGLCVGLQARGYTTEAAADAITGHSIALKTKPSLILLDLGLPGGDGLTLLKKLKTQGPTGSIPVLVLTGRDPQEHEEAARKLGAAGFFQKPPEIHLLIAAIQEQIGDPELQDRTVGGRRKILVVEDDADTRMGLIVRLRQAGYDTAFAADAATVLTVAQREHPDLVILDLGLPAGDGFVVLDRLNKAPSLCTIPVIVLSARDPEANRPRALQAGARAYFHKPADMPDLLEAIRTQLNV
jgi:DNA-binding response OmpR family regulator